MRTYSTDRVPFSRTRNIRALSGLVRTLAANNLADLRSLATKSG